MSDVKPTPGDTDWFVHDRFGLFIHWGLYALPARHEWVKTNEQIPDDVYDSKYFKRFDPDLYDPGLWADAASDAGMKYFVVTTKHHEGFCLWDSEFTDYKAPNTPAGRDLLAPMVDAFRQRDMRVGFYHSLLDWHHPDFTIDKLHSSKTLVDWQQANASRDQARYAQYLHNQVRELLTKFGKIDVMWFDFSYPGPDGKGKDDWQSEKLYALVRELMPEVVLNDRLDLPGGWDIKTPEQFQPKAWVEVDGQKVVWEACQTFSGSWGYHRDETSWKSVDQLVQMLVDTVSKGGNLLLNVGPTGRGLLDDRALDRLAGMGRWMKFHNRSIYGATQAPERFPTPTDCRLTYSPQTNRLYVHVFAWPFKHLHLPGEAFVQEVEYAQLLHDASEINIRRPDSFKLEAGSSVKAGSEDEMVATLELPVQKPDVTVPVIELFLKDR